MRFTRGSPDADACVQMSQSYFTDSLAALDLKRSCAVSLKKKSGQESNLYSLCHTNSAVIMAFDDAGGEKHLGKGKNFDVEICHAHTGGGRN